MSVRLKVLLASLILLFWMAGTAHAVVGVSIGTSGDRVTIGSSKLVSIGPFECPAGSVVTSFNLSSGYYIDAGCSKISVNSSNQVSLSPNGTTTALQAGTMIDPITSTTCPAGHVVVGFKLWQDAKPPILAAVQAICGPLLVNASTGVATVGGTTVDAANIAGRTSGQSAVLSGGAISYAGATNCPAGRMSGGVRGVADTALNEVTFRCYSHASGGLKVTVNVVGGPNVPSDSTVTINDGTIDETIEANTATPVTAGSYTISAALTNYTQTASTCASPTVVSLNALASCTITLTYLPMITGVIRHNATGQASTFATDTACTGCEVRIYNDGGPQAGMPDSSDSLVTTVTTDATGTYSARVSQNGRYWITVTPPAWGGLPGEQTYASANALSFSTAGAIRPLCVAVGGTTSSPTYTNDTFRTTSGACFGGRRGAVAEAATNASTREHVTGVYVGSLDISGVNFGFSSAVVTNTNSSGQGSFEQLILLANARMTTSSMRFVPAVPTNTPSGRSNQWWSIQPATTDLNLTAANTTLDGTPYSAGDGSTVLAPNSTSQLPSIAVGYGNQAGAVPAFSFPNLLLSTTGSGNVLNISASNITLRNLAVTNSVSRAALHVGYDATVSGFLLENSVIGGDPTGATWDNSTSPLGQLLICKGCSGGASSGSTAGTVRNNLITGSRSSTSGTLFQVSGQDSNSNLDISGNRFVQGTALSYLSLASNNFGATPPRIANNWFESGAGDITRGINISSAGASVTGNTVGAGTNAAFVISAPNATLTGNRVDGTLVNSAKVGGGILVLSGTNTVITANLLTNITATTGTGAGVTVRAPASTARITQNIFGGNRLNAIDLGGDGVSTNTSACANSSAEAANLSAARPTITAARLSGTALTFSLSYCATGTYRVELYKAVADPGNTGDTGADGMGAGEGAVFLGALTGLSGGFASDQLITIPEGILNSNDSITALAIDSNGNTSEFSSNFTLSNAPVNVRISGYLFHDKGTPNQTRDGTEDWGGTHAQGGVTYPTMYAKLSVYAAGACQAAEQVVAIAPGTGAYQLTPNAAGNYCVTLSTNNAAADVAPSLPSGWLVSVPGNVARQMVTIVTVSTGIGVPNINFGLFLASGTISGTVFNDSGASGGTLRDGIRNGSEAGIGDALVTLYQGTCADTALGSAVTDNNGQWSIPVSVNSGTALCAAVTNRATTHEPATASVSGTRLVDGTPTTVGGTAYTWVRTQRRIAFAYNGGSHTGLDFGEITGTQLFPNQQRIARPGSVTWFTHTLIAGEAGTAALVVTPASSEWSAVLYLDTNCNGQFDAGESAYSGGLALSAGQTQCLLLKQFIPAQAADGASHTTRLEVTLGDSTLSVTDTTLVSLTALQVLKEVRNLTQGGSFGLINTARGDDVIEYRLTFMNTSSGGITNVVVRDATPAFTTFVAVASVSVPVGMSAPAISAPSVGATGDILWTYNGTLTGGASGVVTYQVRVRN